MARGLSRTDLAVALPAVVLTVLVAWALAPGWFAPFAPTDMDQRAILQGPSAAHVMGTDNFGRDILSLVIYGARQSLLVGVGAVAIGMAFGCGLGLVTGYVGGLVDMAVMRLIEVWMSVPSILLIMMIATAVRPSLTNVILTIGLVSSPHHARVMRSQVMAVKGRPFVEASRSIGGSHLSILIRHVLPHTLSQALVMATLGIGGAMLTGASLSFIGLGVVDDCPDWGYLLSQSRSYLTVAWWFGAFPGMAVTLVVISTNMLGEALRRRLDPRTRLDRSKPR
jgi:peptide/nickel transport system permease protein